MMRLKLGNCLRPSLFVAALAVASSSSADDSDAIRNQVILCLSPPVVPDIERVAEFRVSLNMDGNPAAIDVLSYQPSGKAGLRFAEAGVTAIRRCAPYASSEASITFHLSTRSEGPPVTYPAQ